MKSKLNNLMPAYDKLKHLFVGFLFLICVLTLHYFFEFSLDYVISAQVFLGVGTEIYDGFTEGEVELMDAVFTIFPIVFIVFL